MGALQCDNLQCYPHVYAMLSQTSAIQVYPPQKLLLLPELRDTTATKDGGLVTSYHRYVMPPLKLFNEEIITRNGLRSSSDGSPSRIIVSNLTASWTHVSMLSCVCVLLDCLQDKEKLVLNNVSFRVDKVRRHNTRYNIYKFIQSNRLLAVVGPVGSGKVCCFLKLVSIILYYILLQSSILQCLLRELEALDGSVDIEGSVSYVSQEPWIFSGTIKENILFGKEYDETWYWRVVKCCSLVKVLACVCVV